MKKFMSILAMLAFCFSACAFSPQPIEIPEGCENSIIMNKIGFYKEADFLLTLANVRALKEDAYTKEQVLDFFDDLTELLNTATYAELATFVLEKVKWVNENMGVEILILTEYGIDFLGNDLPIDQCDKELLLKHINKQRRYTQMVVQSENTNRLPFIINEAGTLL